MDTEALTKPNPWRTAVFILLASIIAFSGGMYANNSLSDGMRKKIETQNAVHMQSPTDETTTSTTAAKGAASPKAQPGK